MPYNAEFYEISQELMKNNFLFEIIVNKTNIIWPILFNCFLRTLQFLNLNVILSRPDVAIGYAPDWLTEDRLVSKLILFSDVKKAYDDEFCYCIPKYFGGAFCAKWWSIFDENTCILNGGLNGRYCPGARGITMNGTLVDFRSSHPSVCNKSASKWPIFLPGNVK